MAADRLNRGTSLLEAAVAADEAADADADAVDVDVERLYVDAASELVAWLRTQRSATKRRNEVVRRVELAVERAEHLRAARCVGRRRRPPRVDFSKLDDDVVGLEDVKTALKEAIVLP